MRSLRLMGDYVIPAVREIGDELELKGPFEISPWTNEPDGRVERGRWGCCAGGVGWRGLGLCRWVWQKWSGTGVLLC